MEIPKLLQSDDNCKYILTIIDQFSKFCNAYILSNKKADGVLGHVKEFIFINGKCNKIHTDNGKEFCDSLFNKYCIDNGINHICMAPIIHNPKDVWKASIKKIKIIRDKVFRGS